MRRFAHILLLICTVPGLLAGLTGGHVLCIGPDGHIALEESDCAARECMPPAELAQHDGLEPACLETSRAGCGACWDVVLSSSPLLPSDSRQNAPDHLLAAPMCLVPAFLAITQDPVAGRLAHLPDLWCLALSPARSSVLLI